MNESDAPFNRRVSVLLAFLALLGGLAGYAAADASARRSTTAREAQRASVTALAEQREVSDRVNEQFGNFVETSTVRRTRDIAKTSSELLGRTSAGTMSWQQSASKLNDVSRLLQPGPVEGRADLLWSEMFVPADEATLRQEALQATASDWDDKADQHAGVATLLAISLTLLGLSLTVGAGTRLFLLWPALAIALAGVLGGLAIVVRPVAATPEAAIRAIAEGNRRHGSRDFTGAVASFSEAISLDPDNATAFRQRATATMLADSPERDVSTFVFSSSSVKARKAATADLLHSLELGDENYFALANLGANYFHLGEYDKSEQYSRRAIAMNKVLPTPWVNLMLAQVARGQEKPARATVEHVLALIAQRPLLQERRENYGSVRATLATLVQLEPGRRALAEKVQDVAVRAQARNEVPEAPAEPDGTVTGLTLASNGSDLGMQFTPHKVAEGSRVALVAYYRAEGEQEWSEIPATTTVMAWSNKISPQDRLYWHRLYVTGCRVDGEHRVDVYVDDRKVASKTVLQQRSALELVQYNDVATGLALCRPKTWTLERETTGSADLVSADDRYRVSLRMLPLGQVPGTPAARTKLVGQVLGRLSRQLTAAPPSAAVKPGVYYGRVPGTGRPVEISDLERGYVWAAITTDGELCTVTARFPNGDSAVLDELMRYTFFKWY
ncbi:hypothetical protein OWR29_12835 [Actinoplanes sp. Pm04-4]|uniref:Tetratricopeptide repeat protein n=1 Tax=Paractinoplanes pyxinae TaxID=2997416 RepID=A0ABT4AXC7_9ACTN|nr:hypothetical protein [Actinoplanes pyxinae]MCY1138887.1 hypothetical protein [Actinoplanes pyxinae]